MKENTPLHFPTGNSALALALDTAGHKPIQIINYYDATMLARIGNKLRVPECDARTAWKAGEPGRVLYIFAKSPALDSLIEAWDDQAEQVARATPENPGTPLKGEITPEMLMRIACVLHKKRKPFNTLWEQEIPRLLVPNDGEIEVLKEEKQKDAQGVEHVIERVAILPGFRLCSIDMPAAELAEVGL